MRTTTKLAALATMILAAGLVACGTSGKSGTAAKDDFKRDLELASATNMNLAAPKVDPALLTFETALRGAPLPAPTLKKAAGPKVVRSEAPTVEAAPEPEPVAVEEAAPVVTTVARAPVPEPTPEPVAVAPRPTPAATQPGGGAGIGDYGRGGGVFGGGIGVVIRGGGVDGDNCDLRRRGGPTIIYRSPVYVPRPLTPTVGRGGSILRRGF